MADWRRYKSAHNGQIVEAAKITAIKAGIPVSMPGPLTYEIMVDDEPFAPIEPSMEGAQVGWYAIKHADGQRSASPPDVFESDYTAE